MSTSKNERNAVYLQAACGFAMTAFVVYQTMSMCSLIETCIFWVSTGFMYLRDLLVTNQFCQALIFGSVSTCIAYGINLCYCTFILPFFSGWQSSITIHNTDPNFEAVIEYLSDHAMKDMPQCSLQAATKVKKRSRKDFIAEWFGTANQKNDSFEFRPDADLAIHQFMFQGVKVYLSRSKSGDPLMGGNSDIPFTPQSLKLSVWGSDTTVLRTLLTLAMQTANSTSREGLVTIYTQSNNSWLTAWEASLTKKARPKESVILDQHHMDTLLDDAKTFLGRGEWYANMGIPYRRGYLLYGPPGCGKTSFAQVLAGELGVDICMLNLSHADMDDNKLSEYLRDAPSNSIIVLEDVDAVFVERGVASAGGGAAKNSVSISFSGLLNAIDGVASQEGRIFFMTTNHIEKLDPALVRPGRCDVKLELGYASRQQMLQMFLRFFPGEIELGERFTSGLPANELSMAALQGHFLTTEQTAQECVDNIHTLLQSTRPVTPPQESLYCHLRRIGIEQYTSVLENIGIELASQFSTSKLTLVDLLKMSLELRYDMNAQNRFSQLLESYINPNSTETLTFLSTEYALADVLTLRESFMTAFTQPGAITASCSVNGEAVTVLDTLCKQFCDLLSADGKGILSLNAMSRLVAMFPDQPEACVTHIPAFLAPRPPARVSKSLNLYDFLKRAGMGKTFHNFNQCRNLDALMALDKTTVTDMKIAIKPYNLAEEEASDLAEILTKTVTTRGTVHKFNLPNRKRLIDTFILYYSNAAADESDSGKQALKNQGFEFGCLLTDERGLGLVSLLEVEKFLLLHPTDSAAALANTLLELLRPPQPEAPPPPEPAPPSTEWVVGWLQRGEGGGGGYYEGSLLDDVAPTSQAIITIITPEKKKEDKEDGDEREKEEKKLPAPSPPAADSMERYAEQFLEEGLCSLHDLSAGPLLTDSVLENTLKVSKLGHRRQIIRMQEQLSRVQGKD